jgi:hypothetical protein
MAGDDVDDERRHSVSYRAVMRASLTPPTRFPSPSGTPPSGAPTSKKPGRRVRRQRTVKIARFDAHWVDAVTAAPVGSASTKRLLTTRLEVYVDGNRTVRAADQRVDLDGVEHVTELDDQPRK